jgi:hypothetical protein
MMKRWRTGVMNWRRDRREWAKEYWSDGVMEKLNNEAWKSSNTPIVRYSITPIF